MIDKIYRLPDALAVTGLCRTSLYTHLKEGKFPEPVRLGARAVGWRESQLTEWVNTRQTRTATK